MVIEVGTIRRAKMPVKIPAFCPVCWTTEPESFTFEGWDKGRPSIALYTCKCEEEFAFRSDARIAVYRWSGARWVFQEWEK